MSMFRYSKSMIHFSGWIYVCPLRKMSKIYCIKILSLNISRQVKGHSWSRQVAYAVYQGLYLNKVLRFHLFRFGVFKMISYVQGIYTITGGIPQRTSTDVSRRERKARKENMGEGMGSVKTVVGVLMDPFRYVHSGISIKTIISEMFLVVLFNLLLHAPEYIFFSSSGSTRCNFMSK